MPPSARVRSATSSAILLELLVLRLEKRMQLGEVRPHHVPVEAAGLGVQDEFVGEQGVQNPDHRPSFGIRKSDVGRVGLCPHLWPRCQRAQRRLSEIKVLGHSMSRPVHDRFLSKRRYVLPGMVAAIPVSDNPVDTNNIVSRACSMCELKVRLPCFGKRGCSHDAAYRDTEPPVHCTDSHVSRPTRNSRRPARWIFRGAAHANA